MRVKNQLFFLLSGKTLDGSFKVHGFGFVALDFPALSDGGGFKTPRVFAPFARKMKLNSFFKIVGIACIKGIIAAMKDIHPEALLIHGL